MGAWPACIQTTTYYTINVIHTARTVSTGHLAISVPMLDLTLDGTHSGGGLEAQRQAVQAMPAQTFTQQQATKITIEEAVEQWTSALHAKRQSSQEITRKAWTIRWFSKLAGWKFPSDISAKSTTDTFGQMLSLKPKTITTRLSRLRAFCDYLIEQEVLRANPVKGVKGPTGGSSDGMRALTTQELRALIASVPRSKIERAAYYAIAGWTGMRYSECRRLKWKHVDLSGETPMLTLAADMTKNGKTATLPILEDAIDGFAQLHTFANGPESPVFRTLPSSHTFDKDLQRAGIAKHDSRGRSAGIHSLRKHLATALANGGADIYTAQAMLRHADISTTREIYIDDGVMDLANKAKDAICGGGVSRNDGFFSKVQLNKLTTQRGTTDTVNGRNGKGEPSGPDKRAVGFDSPRLHYPNPRKTPCFGSASPPAPCGGLSESELVASEELFQFFRWRAENKGFADGNGYHERGPHSADGP